MRDVRIASQAESLSGTIDAAHQLLLERDDCLHTARVSGYTAEYHARIESHPRPRVSESRHHGDEKCPKRRGIDLDLLGAHDARVILVALTVPLALQTIRALFPLLFNYGEDEDFMLAGALAVAVYVSPLLAAPVDRWLGPRLAVPAGLAALVVARVAIQLLHPIPLWLGIAATIAALLAVTLQLISLRRQGPGGTRAFLFGLLLGLAVDTALRGLFLTWDLPWQEGWEPLAATIVLAAGAAVAARPWLRAEVNFAPSLAGADGVWSTALLGPFLMLQVLFLQSPAFAASAAEASLEGAVAILLVGDALAILAAAWVVGRPVPSALGLAVGVALAAIAWGLTHLSGATAGLLILVGQLLAAGLLALALDRAVPRLTKVAWRTAAGVGLGAVAFMVLAVGYQIHYEAPLPFSNAFLPSVAGLLMGLAGIRRRHDAAIQAEVRPTSRLATYALVPVALLLVPLGVFLARPDRPVVAGNGESFRLVNYNVHLAVNPDGQLDPEATARTIQALRPDVVALQEAGRGWPVNTTMDVAEWLSRRLRMPFVYQPAADGQFGNAVLSRLPIVSHDGGFLPFGDGPQQRSYLRVEVDLGGGRTVTVIDVHLQHQEASTATREAQILRLLEVWGGAPRTVITGDMNTQPGEANIELFFEAGLLSAQDEAGLGHLPTASQPTVRGDRVDWMLVGPDLAFEDVAVPFSAASDHLPIAATIAFG
jgi:endonuclease/exonuclease/phosphatase family metal-dependent hydrolase